ncbi:hypothetical protein L7F22_056900 [Adiantum nelumboides]|nr:hypothetical protein [Adiantum nelumboides]
MVERNSMSTAKAFEIRLLRCSLSGAEAFPPPKSFGSDCVAHNQKIALLRAVECVVLDVERGAFFDALSSEPLKNLLWQPHNRTLASSGSSPEDIYNSVRTYIHSLLESTNGDEDLQYFRALLVMAAGVAALLTFWQANVTGPCTVTPPCQTLFLQQTVCESDYYAWALKQLMVDGCDLRGLCASPDSLVLAKILLVDTLDTAKTIHSSKVSLPSSLSWWARRALLAHQMVLAERSSSLHAALSSLKPDLFAMDWEGDVDHEDALMLRGAAQLEYGFVEYAYGHIDHARSRFEAASETCGLQLSLTGALGFRTAHQIDPKAQMVLVTSTLSNQRGHSSKELGLPTHGLTKDDGTNPESRGIEEDILMLPKLVSSDTDACKQPSKLSSLQQAVVLAQCLDVKKSNPDDELRGWQMAPFIEAVDSQEVSHFLVKCCCQLLRIGWEHTRSRTKQRALLMLEQLVEDVCGNPSSNVQERMCYAFCLHFPMLSVLRKELAEMMVSCGLVGEALKIFKELELWNSLVDCYCLLGKKGAALDLIKERLKEHPDEPRLWCALGDVTLDEDCYRKAWEVSKHHFGRAQRSLGRSAYNKGDYARSVEHWEAALSLNSLHADGWFALGSASLKARNLDKAVDAFTRSVQLEPENGEAWNNVAAVHMTRKKSKEAFVAFREALKYKRSSWQMWENYAHVALDVGNFGQAIEAVTMVLDLSQGKRNVDDCLTKLMEEVEARFHRGFSSNEAVHSIAASKDLVTDDGTLVQDASPWEDGVLGTVLHAAERDWLETRVGKLVSKAIQISPTSATWGLLARWHHVRGDLTMCSEALLKQVRSLQGSGWQHNKDQYEDLCHAALRLCDVYTEVFLKTGNKKELYSVQMLLRSLVKQGESFSYAQVYGAIATRLADVQCSIQNS